MNLESLLADIIAVNQSVPRLHSVPEALGLIRQAELRLVSVSVSRASLLGHAFTEQEANAAMSNIAKILAAESIRLVAFLDSLKTDSPRDTIPAPPASPELP